MSRNLRLVYVAHSVRSDWNNGNAHFLRGLLRSLSRLGHQVTILEPEEEWSLTHLRTEPRATTSLQQFHQTYPELRIQTYPSSSTTTRESWRALLQVLGEIDILILHEWTPPALAPILLDLRPKFGYKLLFHDTHHRASSSPESFAALELSRFDGVLAFGEVLRRLYRERFGMDRVWVLHEAADTSVFHPQPATALDQDVVWIGNWGDDERSGEVREFLVAPAADLFPQLRTKIYGVRYPDVALEALRQANIEYGGYLPNLDAPLVYARSRLTVHIPRRQYAEDMPGIPTIRVFEALACGIPLISAPWQDTEHLFRPGDLQFVRSGAEMKDAMQGLLTDPSRAAVQAAQGLEAILARHTCDHRAQELTTICQELLQ